MLYAYHYIKDHVIPIRVISRMELLSVDDSLNVLFENQGNMHSTGLPVFEQFFMSCT